MLELSVQFGATSVSAFPAHKKLHLWLKRLGVRFLIGFQVALPASSLSITRRIYQIIRLGAEVRREDTVSPSSQHRTRNANKPC